MTEETTVESEGDSEQSVNRGAERRFARPAPVRDIAIVGVPIVVLGSVGTLLGLETLAGGAVVNLGYVLAVTLGAVLLARQGSSWVAIGLSTPTNWARTALAGAGAFVGALVVFVVVQGVAIWGLTALGVADPALDGSRFNQVEGNLPLYLLLVALAWTTIAVGEEWFYRAFLLTRLVDHATVGKWVAILLAGAVFGAVHFAEGPVGVLSNGAFGVFFGWVYLRSGRNLWITVVGHALLNTVRFTLLYLGLV